MELFDTVFLVAVIIFSTVIHEVMHGVAADRLGDLTARYAGRLTLNPLPHLDLWGSIIIPITLVLSHSPIFFGWAKPVPYNPYNLRPGHFSEAIVAGAGPFSNAVIALLATAVIRLQLWNAGADILFVVVVVNVMLCFFNLIPIPPLDGSKILSALLPRSLRFGYDAWRNRIESNPFLGMFLVLIFVMFLSGAFGSFVYTMAHSLAGM